MPRNKKWSDEENALITGVLNVHGSPRSIELGGWPEEVRKQVRDNLASRTDSGIYQQSLKLLRSRHETTPTADDQGFMLAKGA
jgi:hypothetical protein